MLVHIGGFAVPTHEFADRPIVRILVNSNGALLDLLTEHRAKVEVHLQLRRQLGTGIPPPPGRRPVADQG